jgi:hypothetical protein
MGLMYILIGHTRVVPLVFQGSIRVRDLGNRVLKTGVLRKRDLIADLHCLFWFGCPAFAP